MEKGLEGVWVGQVSGEALSISRSRGASDAQGPTSDSTGHCKLVPSPLPRTPSLLPHGVLASHVHHRCSLSPLWGPVTAACPSEGLLLVPRIQTAPSSRRQIASDGRGFRGAGSGCQERCRPLTFSWQNLHGCQRGCLAGPVAWRQRAL